MGYIKALQCRECRREYSIRPVHVCEFCFGPLEVVYDYEKVKGDLSREKIEERPKSMWRYREVLPLDSDPSIGSNVGFTPLIRCLDPSMPPSPLHLYKENGVQRKIRDKGRKRDLAYSVYCGEIHISLYLQLEPLL